MVSKKEYLEYAGKLVEKSITGNRKLLSVWSKVGLILLIILGGIITIRSVAIMLIIRRINRNFVIGVSLIVISIILLVKRSKMLKLYRGEIREKLIAYLLKDNSYYFDKSGWISSYEFENSQFSRKYDCFSSCDLLSINIPNDDGSESKIDLEIADVNAYDVSVDEEGNRTTHDVYKGMFGYARFKSINEEV